MKIKMYKTIILPVVLYGCKTWSNALREERKQTGSLGRIFGLITVGNWEWRRLHNEEHHSFYRSPNIVRVLKSRKLSWADHVA